jgi:hypothetical protein
LDLVASFSNHHLEPVFPEYMLPADMSHENSTWETVELSPVPLMFDHLSGAEWEKGPGQRKRPYTASTQPLSLRDGYLVPHRW